MYPLKSKNIGVKNMFNRLDVQKDVSVIKLCSKNLLKIFQAIRDIFETLKTYK